MADKKEKESKKTKAHIRYKLADGSTVPGVTTVLGLLDKPALKVWANKLGLQNIELGKYVDNLADIGTLAHAMVTDKLEGKPTPTDEYSKDQIDKAENCALSFWQWAKEHPIEKVYFCERPLVSETMKYGGTLDILCRVGGQDTIIDLKTGSGIWPEAVMQVATLKRLLEENGHHVDGLRVLNIPRAETEAFIERVVSPEESEVGWNIFKHLLEVYNLKKLIK